MPSLFGLTAAFGAPLPELLAELLRFQNSDPEPYNEGFELAEVEVDAIMTEAAPQDGRLLLPFGINGHGSVFGLWAGPDQPLDQAPVVFVDVEGREDRVIARNVADFLGLLALDQEDPINMVDLATYEEKMVERGWSHSPRWPALVDWLKASHGIRAPRDPQRSMERAEEACPGFRAWMGHDDEEPVPVPIKDPRVGLKAAVAIGDLEEVQKHLDEGLDPNARDARDAVEQAIRIGRDDVLATLLGAGLDPDRRLAYDNSLLLHAALYGRRACVKRLLAAGADPDATNELGETADLLAEDNDPVVADAIKAMLQDARGT